MFNLNSLMGVDPYGTLTEEMRKRKLRQVLTGGPMGGQQPQTDILGGAARKQHEAAAQQAEGGDQGFGALTSGLTALGNSRDAEAAQQLSMTPNGPVEMNPSAISTEVTPRTTPPFNPNDKGGLDDLLPKGSSMAPQPTSDPNETRMRIVPNEPIRDGAVPQPSDQQAPPPPAAAPPPQQKPMSRSEQIMQEIEAEQKAGPQVEKSFWKRLASIAPENMATFEKSGRPGDEMGAAGNLVGSVIGAFDKKGEAERRHKAGLAGLWKSYETEAKKEDYQAERQAKNLKYLREENEPFYKSITADDVVTPEEAKMAADMGFGKIIPYDNRNVDHEVRNGKTNTGYMKGPGAGVYSPNKTIPTELGGEYYPTELPGTKDAQGNPVKVPLNPAQAASTAVGVAQANAGREERAATRQEGETDEDAKSLATFNQRQNDARAKLRAAQAELKTYDPAFDTDKIAKANGEIAAANSILSETAPTGNAKQKPKATKEADARKYYQKKGKSPEEIERLMKKGREQGVIE